VVASPTDGSMAVDGPRLVTIRNLSKLYPGTQALDAVDLSIRRGEIHALCGGNGSGKSTLIRILSGIERGEPGGSIEIAGRRVPADSTTAQFSHESGIRTVHQNLAVFQDMTVAENLMLGGGFALSRIGNIRWMEVYRRAEQLLARFEISAHPKDLMSDLPQAIQTQVAIAKALQDIQVGDDGLLILDEPTASLPQHEVETLFEALRSYAASGLSILLVTHRLDEVKRLSDRVSVLKDGRMLGVWPTQELTERRLIELIVGFDLEVVGSSGSGTSNQVLLEVSNLRADKVRGASFTVRSGEVVGIAGLLGSGRSELLRAIYGDLPHESGQITFLGRDCQGLTPASAMALGMAFIPEDRAQEAAFPDQTVAENIAVSVLRKYWTKLHVDFRGMRSDAEFLAETFKVKSSGVGQEFQTLSGGNQQKVILARWIQRKPKLLLLDEPTQGVDVGARHEIYLQIRAAVNEGAAAILVASDLEELAEHSDRVVVLKDGRIRAEVPKDEISAQRLSQQVFTEEVHSSDGY